MSSIIQIVVLLQFLLLLAYHDIGFLGVFDNHLELNIVTYRFHLYDLKLVFCHVRVRSSLKRCVHFYSHFERFPWVYFFIDSDFSWAKSLVTVQFSQSCILDFSVARIFKRQYSSNLLIRWHNNAVALRYSARVY